MSIQPFDAAEVISFKSPTLKDLSSMLAKVEPFGVSLDRFLQVLAERLRPRSEAPATPLVACPPRSDPLNGEMRDRDGSPSSELEILILKGMLDLDPAVQTGASVLLHNLRSYMPAEYRRHETFDAAVIRLAEQGRVVLHRHDQPSILTDAERDELVRDGLGTYYTSIAHRV